MENITMNPTITATITSAWQLPLSATAGCAMGVRTTGAPAALATLEVQGIAVRPAAFATAAAPCAAVTADATKRQRGLAGTRHSGTNAAYVWGSPAWSPPI